MMDKCKLKFHVNDDDDDDGGGGDDDDDFFPVLEENAQPMSFPDETSHTHTLKQISLLLRL